MIDGTPAIDTDFSQDPSFTTTDPSDFYWHPNAQASGDCGAVKSDWRLPNVNELFSLVDREQYNPGLSDTAGTGQWSEGDPFANVQFALPPSPPYYWSTTTDAHDTSHAWFLDFYNGSVAARLKTEYHYVWPVRGGQ